MRKNKRLISEMNVVPYVDVMLVLVIILMVTTPMLTQGVVVSLPAAKAKVLDVKDQLPIIVTVAPNGDMSLNIATNPKITVASDVVQLEVAAALKRNPERKVLLQGDKLAAYETIMNAMVLLQGVGVTNIGLQTHDELNKS